MVAPGAAAKACGGSDANGEQDLPLTELLAAGARGFVALGPRVCDLVGPGDGDVVCELVDRVTRATRQYAKYPLKFLTKRPSQASPASFGPSLPPPGQRSGGGNGGSGSGHIAGDEGPLAWDGDVELSPLWVFLINFGGGMVNGDRLRVRLDVRKDSTCVLTTQGAAKVYKSPGGRRSAQRVYGRVGAGGLLCVLVEPVICFANAVFRQEQTFWLHGTGSLVLLDWFTSGRKARDESWAFTDFSTCNRIFVGDAICFNDAIVLNNAGAGDTGGSSGGSGGSGGDSSSSSGATGAGTGTGCASVPTLAERMRGMHAVCTCVVIGPRVAGIAESILQGVNGTPIRKHTTVVVSASELRGGSVDPEDRRGVVLRVAGEAMEDVRSEVERHLAALADLLGADPWKRT